MFTGIVEEIGVVKDVQKGNKSNVLFIEANKILEGTKIGDSICTNGVCLTVTNINKNIFSVDVMSETMRRSSLKELGKGSKVNLERALRLQDRLGGHIVSGHIDGIGKIVSIIREDNAIWYAVKTEENLLRYIVEKGSIAIDGISLTVAYVDTEKFKVSIIPHTAKETILSIKNVGDKVNLECDIIGKYVEKLIGGSKETAKSKIDKNFLMSNGFI